VAISRERMTFSWGKNDNAQLALGKLGNSEPTPQLVKTLQGNLVVKVVCGDNYTCVITGEEKLLVCGNMERGKLGLGSAFQTGVCFILKEV